jgi:hypothetical protein
MTPALADLLETVLFQQTAEVATGKMRRLPNGDLDARDEYLSMRRVAVPSN